MSFLFMDIVGFTPISEYYNTAEALTSLGIGEALVTTLDEKGRPTPLAATMMRAPMSRMDVLKESELDELIKTSELISKYDEVIDRESAYEMLNDKIKKAEDLKKKEDERLALEKEREAIKKEKESKSRRKSSTRYQRQNPVVKVLTSSTFIRAVFGVLKKVMK